MTLRSSPLALCLQSHNWCFIYSSSLPIFVDLTGGGFHASFDRVVSRNLTPAQKSSCKYMTL